MTPCPSDEKLTGLLADALSTAERDALRGTWKDAPLARDGSPA